MLKRFFEMFISRQNRRLIHLRLSRLGETEKKSNFFQHIYLCQQYHSNLVKRNIRLSPGEIRNLIMFCSREHLWISVIRTKQFIPLDMGRTSSFVRPRMEAVFCLCHSFDSWWFNMCQTTIGKVIIISIKGFKFIVGIRVILLTLIIK